MKRLIQSVSFLFLLTVVFLGMTSCGNDSTYIIGKSVYCNYDQLTEAERTIYDSLCEEIRNFNFEFHFTDVDEDAVGHAYLSVLADHPEFFWLGNEYSYNTVSTDDKTDLTLTPIAMDPDAVPEMQAQLAAMVDSVISNAKDQSTAFDQIIYIHDFLIEHTQYDNEAYRLVSSGQQSETILNSTTAYGCLVNGQAICSGYSAAFQYLAQSLGYQCGRVSGFKKGGESHERNYILLDDEYYFIDVTWDDPVSPDGTSNSKSYEFFCITTDEMLHTHEIDKDQVVPQCRGTKYDYFVYKGLFFEEYDFDKVSEVINLLQGSVSYSLKFMSESECQKALEDLIDNGRIFDINNEFKERGEISYSIGTSGQIITIYAE